MLIYGTASGTYYTVLRIRTSKREMIISRQHFVNNRQYALYTQHIAYYILGENTIVRHTVYTTHTGKHEPWKSDCKDLNNTIQIQYFIL